MRFNVSQAFLLLSSAWIAPLASAWQVMKGYNCYNGHGATEIDTNPTVTLFVGECEDLCDKMPECTGVTVDASGGSGHVYCWRRKDISLYHCDKSEPKYDTYVNPSAPIGQWTREPAVNCYGGHGATDLDADPLTSMSISDCKAECDSMPGCTGITIATSSANKPGDCWRLKDIALAQCDKSFGSKYDTYIQSGPCAPPAKQCGPSDPSAKRCCGSDICRTPPNCGGPPPPSPPQYTCHAPSPPPPPGCSLIKGACKEDKDCCPDWECGLNFCDTHAGACSRRPPPPAPAPPALALAAAASIV